MAALQLRLKEYQSEVIQKEEELNKTLANQSDLQKQVDESKKLAQESELQAQKERELIKQLKHRTLAYAILQGKQIARTKQIAEEKRRLEGEMQDSAAKLADLKAKKE